jgi:hypothetical protein
MVMGSQACRKDNQPAVTTSMAMEVKGACYKQLPTQGWSNTHQLGVGSTTLVVDVAYHVMTNVMTRETVPDPVSCLNWQVRDGLGFHKVVSLISDHSTSGRYALHNGRSHGSTLAKA